MEDDPEIQELIYGIMERIVRDRTLAFPWYQPWIRSEQDAEENADLLPLVYSWNEVVSGGVLQSFSVSVNGTRMAELLIPHMPREHPAFRRTLSLLVGMLAKAQDNTLVGICREFGLSPSQVSAKLQQ